MSIRVDEDRLTYNSWNAMINRCKNPALRCAKDYKDRGITVWAKWTGPFGYETFREDMGPRPSKDHSLDRINNDLGYSPLNCRWATEAVQQRNRRPQGKHQFRCDVNTLTYGEQTHTYADWIKLLPDNNLNARKMRQRVAAGWPVGEVLGILPHKIVRSNTFSDRKAIATYTRKGRSVSSKCHRPGTPN